MMLNADLRSGNYRTNRYRLGPALFIACVSMPSIGCDHTPPCSASTKAIDDCIEGPDEAGKSIRSIAFMLYTLGDLDQEICALATKQQTKQQSSWRGNLARFKHVDTFDASNEVWEAGAAAHFTLEKRGGLLSRECRFARVQACIGNGSLIAAVANKENSKISLGEIGPNDPIADCIILVEVKSSKVLWDKPGDFDQSQKTDQATIERFASNSDSFHVAFADTSVWRLKLDTPIEKLRPFFSINGAKEKDREEELAEFVLHRLPPAVPSRTTIP